MRIEMIFSIGFPSFRALCPLWLRFLNHGIHGSYGKGDTEKKVRACAVESLG